MGILVDASFEMCFYFSKYYDIKFTVYLRKVTGSLLYIIKGGHPYLWALHNFKGWGRVHSVFLHIELSKFPRAHNQLNLGWIFTWSKLCPFGKTKSKFRTSKLTHLESNLIPGTSMMCCRLTGRKCRWITFCWWSRQLPSIQNWLQPRSSKGTYNWFGVILLSGNVRANL
jgi:hypothetical protein